MLEDLKVRVIVWLILSFAFGMLYIVSKDCASKRAKCAFGCLYVFVVAFLFLVDASYISYFTNSQAEEAIADAGQNYLLVDEEDYILGEYTELPFGYALSFNWGVNNKVLLFNPGEGLKCNDKQSWSFLAGGYCFRCDGQRLLITDGDGNIAVNTADFTLCRTAEMESNLLESQEYGMWYAP